MVRLFLNLTFIPLMTWVIVLRDAQTSTPDMMGKLVFYFDGEKDPRNLMIVFSVLLVPMTEWDMATCAQVSLKSSLSEMLVRRILDHSLSLLPLLELLWA